MSNNTVRFQGHYKCLDCGEHLDTRREKCSCDLREEEQEKIEARCVLVAKPKSISNCKYCQYGDDCGIFD